MNYKNGRFFTTQVSYLYKISKKYEPFIATEFISSSENQFGKIDEQRLQLEVSLIYQTNLPEITIYYSKKKSFGKRDNNK